MQVKSDITMASYQSHTYAAKLFQFPAGVSQQWSIILFPDQFTGCIYLIRDHPYQCTMKTTAPQFYHQPVLFHVPQAQAVLKHSFAHHPSTTDQ